jgi:hypothetical protein
MSDHPLIPRAAWGSQFKPRRRMALPVERVYLHHSVTNPTANPCDDAKAIERVGIARFGQLSYSYMIHPTGVILEGCAEWVGAHTSGQNTTSFGVCFIGNNLNGGMPTPQALSAAAACINALRGFGLTVGSPRILPHSAVKATACPGLQPQEIEQLRFATGGRP